MYDAKVVSVYLNACEALENINCEVFVDSSEFAVFDKDQRAMVLHTVSVDTLSGFAIGYDKVKNDEE